jgi:hypothetical protein
MILWCCYKTVDSATPAEKKKKIGNTDVHADRQTDKESQTAGKQAVRQTDTQTDRQKDS